MAKKQKDKPKKKNKNKQEYSMRGVHMWVALAFVSAVLCILYAAYQIKTYEEGIIEIYASQQDAYVQLVLDQININKSEKTEDDIMEIIATLDASNNKYWTLAHEQTMVFVKDVTETNKYKGFTTGTYYISDSAQKFIDGLTINRVDHEVIDVGERQYITSGVVFQYEGGNYQICLLTNPEAVLDQNAYLGSRVNLSLMIGVIVAIYLVTVMSMSRFVSKRTKSLQTEQQNNKNLAHMIEALNEQIAESTMYDVRLSLFRKDYFSMLFSKLQNRALHPVTFMLIRYDSEEARQFFLQDSVLMMEKRIVRFKDDSNRCILLAAVSMDKTQAKKAVEWIAFKELHLAAIEEYHSLADVTSEQVLERLYEKVTEDGK